MERDYQDMKDNSRAIVAWNIGRRFNRRSNYFSEISPVTSVEPRVF